LVVEAETREVIGFVEHWMVSSATVMCLVGEFFVRSHDFNGIPVRHLLLALEIEWPVLQEELARLAKNEQITLVFASRSDNPNIRRIAGPPIDTQVKLLSKEPLDGICVYPTPSVIRAIDDRPTYEDQPFTKRLALAEPQLTPVFFELNVLERYFRDPRYRCWFGDSEGSISIGNDAYFSEDTAERDKISLQSFGIGYDERKNRVVVVFLRDLGGLSAEH
jgi:hypothetical protein